VEGGPLEKKGEGALAFNGGYRCAGFAAGPGESSPAEKGRLAGGGIPVTSGGGFAAVRKGGSWRGGLLGGERGPDRVSSCVLIEKGGAATLSSERRTLGEDSAR